MTTDTSTLTPTRAALTRLAAATTVLGSLRIPEMQGSARAVAALGAAEQASKLPDDSLLDKAREDLLVAARTGAFQSVPIKHLREAPWLLWAKKQPLAGLPGLLDAVSALAKRPGSVRRKLIQAWLLGFAVDAPQIEEGAHVIRHVLAMSPDARLEQWRHADQAFDLFDARQGPRNVARAILTAPSPVDAILTEAGLDNPVQAGGGYARAVQQEVLAQFAPALQKALSDEIVTRCVAFLAPGDTLRFDEAEARGAVARGLMAPWLHGGPLPEDRIRALVEGFLLRTLGDPRLRPQTWAHAGEEAKALMRSWLGRMSFRAFFKLIDEIASDRQWRYRQAFWSAYIRENYVDDIWLALGNTLHASARSVKELNGAYAKMSGSNQAVLLFRIKHLVFCEWSNVGKVRAWPLHHAEAPRLDAWTYSAADLKGHSLMFDGHTLRLSSDGGLRHDGTEYGSWQSKTAAFISRETGIRLMGFTDWRTKP